MKQEYFFEKTVPTDEIKVHITDRERFFSQYSLFAVKTAQSTVEMCRVVFEAREELSRDEFSEFCTDIGHKGEDSTIRKYLAIGAAYDRLIQYADKLPNSWTSIYTITQIPSDTFNALAQVGESFAKLSGNQIKALVEINSDSKKAPSTDATSSAKTTSEVVSSESPTTSSAEDTDKSLKSNSETSSEVSDVLLTSTTEATNSEQELSNKSAKSNSTRESVGKATQAQSMKELNIDALIELAISTAIFRSDYDNQTDIEEFDLNDSWDVIAKRALHNLKSVGVDITNLNIDKYDIAQSFCGMDSESLDDLLSDLN
jgi:hypothetical protein